MRQGQHKKVREEVVVDKEGKHYQCGQRKRLDFGCCGGRSSRDVGMAYTCGTKEGGGLSKI